MLKAELSYVKLAVDIFMFRDYKLLYNMQKHFSYIMMLNPRLGLHWYCKPCVILQCIVVVVLKQMFYERECFIAKNVFFSTKMSYRKRFGIIII